MKICTKCNLKKDTFDFYKSKNNNDGLTYNCKQCIKEYKIINKNKIAKYEKSYRLKNKEKIKEYQSLYQPIYQCNKIKNDINFKLKYNLRSRLRLAIKNNQKSGSAVDDLGCSIEELRKHLESKFQDDMSWDNHGEWHIDHIKPLAKFDLSDREQLKKACHYTNLQPLWAEDNLKKGTNLHDVDIL